MSVRKMRCNHYKESCKYEDCIHIGDHEENDYCEAIAVCGHVGNKKTWCEPVKAKSVKRKVTEKKTAKRGGGKK